MSDVDANTLARIFVKFNGEAVKAYKLRKGRIIIGSTPENQVQIESNLISEHHAMLVTGESGSTIMDLGSDNGLFLGNQRIEFRAPLATSPALQRVVGRLRDRVPAIAEDRFLAGDIEAAAALVRDGALVAAAWLSAPELGP